MSNGTRKYISTSNPEKSNWVRYIRPAPARKQRNVAAVYKDDQLFFITCRNISKGEEILYWMDDPDLLWTKKKCEKKSKFLKGITLNIQLEICIKFDNSKIFQV